MNTRSKQAASDAPRRPDDDTGQARRDRGVGTYAIQLAKHLGAIVATTTGTSNVDWVRDLGADIVIDYRTQDFETLVHDYDVVRDSQGGETLAKSLRVLKPGGTAIGIAGPPDPDFARPLR